MHQVDSVKNAIMTKRKICFIVSSPLTAKSFLLEHFKQLAVEFDIYLIANFPDNDSKVISNHVKGVYDVKIERNISLFKDVRILFQLKNILNNEAFDAIHTITPKAGLVGIIAGRLAGIKVRTHIFTGQVWHTKSGLFKSVLKFLDRIIVYNATYILVDGESQRQFLIKNHIVNPTNSFVLGKGSISGVDTNRFVPDSTIKSKVREELGIKESDIVFMFLGRMNRDKGIPELAMAFAELLKSNPNSKLLLVGGDEENMTPIVEATINDPSKVIFYGLTPYPERLLQACDVFCLPSHREGFGTSIIEASLLEKPIICSNTYGLMETIINNQTGIRHDVNDVNGIIEAMRMLHHDGSLRNKLGKNGRNYVLENFTAKQISEQWFAFYKNILNV